MVMWQEYKKLKTTKAGSVLQLQSEAYAKQPNENRHYLKIIAKVILLTATQNMVQRSHRELNCDNPGNFKKLLHLVIKHDNTIFNRFFEGTVVTRKISKDIKNEILIVMSDLVRAQIIEEVGRSIYFSIMVDETKT